MKSKRWTIYCHIHRESGRRYVGLTSKTMLARWNDHVYKAKSSKGGRWHFPNAIRKYGKDAFSHEVLQVCFTLEEANEREQFWIWTYDTRNPLRGFNLAKGGKHVPHPIRKNPWDDPEYRRKASVASKRKWQDPEFRVKMGARDYDTSGLRRPDVLQRQKERWAHPATRLEASLRMREVMSDPVVKSRVSASAKGRIMNDDQRVSISSRMTGHSKSSSVKEKISSTLRGRVLSEETRRKISEARKRQVISPETRAKISCSNIGKRHSDESKRRMSIVQKKLAAESRRGH